MAPEVARMNVVEGLQAERAAIHHPSDGGGRAWIERENGVLPYVVAGRSARVPFVFEVGPLGIVEDGRVLFQVSPFWGWATPQVEAPHATGYTTVGSDAEGVRLEPETIDQQLLAIHVRGRALVEGERIRIVYGAGAAGAVADRYAEEASRFWFGVDGDGDGVRAWIEESPAVRVIPGTPSRMLLHLPATARPGDAVNLVVAVTDRMANTGVLFEGEVRLEADPGLVAPSRVVFAASHAGRRSVPVTVRAPGVHRVRAEGPLNLRAESNPLRADAEAPRVLFGDLHGHSALSDGTGTPDDYFRYARDVAGLDVVALTDHDHWGIPFLDASPELWNEIQESTRRFHAPGRFVTILGWEWTSWIHGHRHVLHFEDEGTIHSSIEPESDEPAELWAALRGRPALTFAHHSAGGVMATDWRTPPDPELEPVTEIVSAHGSSEALDSPGVIYSPVPGNFVRDVLGRGFRLGFIGSGDGHDGHPGLTHLAMPNGGVAAILAEERTREAVLAALRARRTYATNGPRIVVDARLGGRPMGASVPPGDHPLVVTVAAPRPLERIDVIRQGRSLERIPLADGAGDDEIREARIERAVSRLRDGDWLYLRIVQRDGGAAWTSPFFIDSDAGSAPE